MYDDDCFPDFLVDKIKAILTGMCEQIEKQTPDSSESLFVLTHEATKKINALDEAFEPGKVSGITESLCNPLIYLSI